MYVMKYVPYVVLFAAIMSITNPVLWSEEDQSKLSPVIEESKKTSEETTPYREGEASQIPAIELSSASVVYYFHGYQRCWTCKRIEELAHLALEEGFSDELETGQLQWKVVNIEADGNEHFVNDYSLYSKALVVQKVENGKNTDWKNLQRVWELVRDDKAFVKYVQDEDKSIMGASR
jgi:hypothetical protein